MEASDFCSSGFLLHLSFVVLKTADAFSKICLFQAGKAQIIGPEEEDEEDDGYAFNEVRVCGTPPALSRPHRLLPLMLLCVSQMDGPFQDIELLKTRPAHMTVFMRYVFTQLLDPNPLVCAPPPPHTHTHTLKMTPHLQGCQI